MLYQRLGINFALLWLCVGAVLGFNVVFNYTMACVIKANGPKELRSIELLRKYYKQRGTRKEADLDNDRFEGISADVKRTLRYRTKLL